MPFSKEIYRKRRKELLDQLPHALILLEGEGLKIRNNDAHFPFRQDSSFHYLTGFNEPNAKLFLWRENGKDKSVIFVPPKDKLRELWDGKRLGVEDAPEALGVDEAFSSDQWRAKLPEFMDGFTALAFDQFKLSAFTGAIREAAKALYDRSKSRKMPPVEFIHVDKSIQTMRIKKEPSEIEIMRDALKVTSVAHQAAMAMSTPGKWEYEIQAIIDYVYQKNHCKSAYEHIVAGGANACVLHYVENDCKLEDGTLLLIDSGAEKRLYASDITRTFPINGKFTPEQRDLYQVVLESQYASIEEAKIGSSLSKVHNVARKKLMEGIRDLKIVDKSMDELMEGEDQRRYYPHGTGHWLGLDVHDPNPYFMADDKEVLFEEGHVFTIEPGLYFQDYHDEIDPKWRGMGIRIEDNILITANGSENLSKAIPKTIEEVEQACAKDVRELDLL